MNDDKTKCGFGAKLFEHASGSSVVNYLVKCRKELNNKRTRERLRKSWKARHMRSWTPTMAVIRQVARLSLDVLEKTIVCTSGEVTRYGCGGKPRWRVGRGNY